jgi:hypothetical protein
VPAGLDQQTVINEALNLLGQQKTITAFPNGTTPSNVAAIVYAPLVNLLLREMDPAFARFTVPLTIAVAPPNYPPWLYEYLYPSDCMRLRQVRPPGTGTGSLPDVNDPSPIRANVAFDVISATVTQVILTNQVNALAVYTSNLITEAQWDSVFQDAMVRRLGNVFAMALGGRPDFARTILEESAAEASMGEAVDEGNFRRPH